MRFQRPRVVVLRAAAGTWAAFGLALLNGCSSVPLDCGADTRMAAASAAMKSNAGAVTPSDASSCEHPERSAAVAGNEAEYADSGADLMPCESPGCMSR